MILILKYFKQILTLSIIGLFIVGCNTPERSIGMTNWTDDGTEFINIANLDQISDADIKRITGIDNSFNHLIVGKAGSKS